MRRRKLLTALGAMALTQAVGERPASAQASAGVTGFLDRTMTINGAPHRYVVYIPRNYSADRKWPVILFLHGAGERGSDGLKQSQVGLGTAVRMFPERYPAIVVMPQCATDQRWDGEMAEFALKAFDQTVAELNGDPDRLYLTGLSMGGAGSWYLGTRYPEKWAAVVSICGRGDVPAITEKLKDKPVWVFVGDKDQAATVQFAREVSAALKNAGSARVRYTEYPGVPHNSWDPAYAEKELATWLFAQKRGQ
ncbi:MAG: esterase [Armatimonadetes bacterium]|jgi:predicted peptidase|nr:esterase [Armatimonadota bacterium]